MLIADCLIVAGALGTGILIGVDCGKLSARAKVAEAADAQDRAICRVEDLAGRLFEVEAELAAVREELEAEQLAHHEARERSAAEILRAGRLPGWMQAAFLPLRCEVEVSGNVARFPERIA